MAFAYKTVMAVALIASAVDASGGVLFNTGGGDLSSAVALRDAFRAELGGGTTPGAAGLFGGVRREINWDAVPDGFSSPNSLPANFFNSNSARGAIFSTPGSGFQVSANSGIAPVRFDNINAAYSAEFSAFSAQRLFTAVGSNVMTVNFFVAGTSQVADTRGFGVIFTGADRTDSTQLEVFDVLGNLLGSSYGAAGQFSFIGALWDGNGPRIGSVRITSGNTALGGIESGNIDLVVMDDFIYGEPNAVPEPSTMLLTAGGIGALWWTRRRKA